MMEARLKAEMDMQSLVGRLFERLRTEAPAYDWDDSLAPFHSVCSIPSSRVPAAPCDMLTMAHSLTTIGMFAAIGAPHNSLTANRANLRVERPVETAQDITKETGRKSEKEVYPMRNKAMMSLLESLAIPPALSASLVLPRSSK